MPPSQTTDPAAVPMQPPVNMSSPVAAPSAGFSFSRMFAGRLSRLGYLLAIIYLVGGYVAVFLVLALLYAGVNSLDGGQLQTIPVVFNIVMFLVGAVSIIGFSVLIFAIQARRWHDLNCSGWLVLIGFIPLVSLVNLLLFFLPGTAGPNHYGEPYSGGSRWRQVLGL